jgi:hypothetical protein
MRGRLRGSPGSMLLRSLYAVRTTARAGSSSTAGGFGSTRSRIASNCPSACCTSRLGRGNAQQQTHRKTSSNYLCTNDTAGWRLTPPRPEGRSHRSQLRELVSNARIALGGRDLIPHGHRCGDYRHLGLGAGLPFKVFPLPRQGGSPWLLGSLPSSSRTERSPPRPEAAGGFYDDWGVSPVQER